VKKKDIFIRANKQMCIHKIVFSGKFIFIVYHLYQYFNYIVAVRFHRCK